MATCSGVREKSSGKARLKVLGRRLRERRLTAMIDRDQLELARPGILGGKRHRIAGLDHSRKAAVKAPQPAGPTRRLGGDATEDSHLQHSVRDDPRQADRPREGAVEVNRVVIARRFRIGRDLFVGEGNGALGPCHGRMTNSARERQTPEPSSAVVWVSKVTNRIPLRLMSETTRPCEVTVSPGLGWRSHSNSWSACKSLAKSMAASGSPKSWGAVTPNEYTAAKIGGTPSPGPARARRASKSVRRQTPTRERGRRYLAAVAKRSSSTASTMPTIFVSVLGSGMRNPGPVAPAGPSWVPPARPVGTGTAPTGPDDPPGVSQSRSRWQMFPLAPPGIEK